MSLERVLEPEVMDTLAEAHDYDCMDHRGVNQAFVADLLRTGDIGTEVLDLGTGTAQIPVVLCQQDPHCRVMGIDLAAHMLDLARYNIEVEGFTNRIFLQQIDSKDLSMESDSFDTVMSNSIIHHIPEPLAAITEAIRVVRIGGLLFFRDLMRPTTDEQVVALVKQYAGEENEHQQQMFDDSLRAALSLAEIRELISSLGFDDATVQASSDRHWTWIARK
ncbi:MAG: class I SAM-dependent methyltransferase [Planctomycetaceae bacterium]|jgi:ubiquinone/menaquinone biosynthesis C-methylase UbiE|nr:class I SAM-dependent methyltransferase [Planctomycetaceae bacterium]